MHSIGSFGWLAAEGLKEISTRLPWGWFLVLGTIDAALVTAVLFTRSSERFHRLARHLAHRIWPEMVMRSGWSVPRSRAPALRTRPATYAWPLHREYLVTRLP